jgi:hypothetical protein
MFLNNTVFNQDIRNWNVSSSTVTTNIFNNATAMNTLYSDFINASGITDTFFRSIFTFNNNNIKQALTDYTTDTTNGSLKYGSISTWELHNVTSMSQLFTFVSGSYEINYNNIAGIDSWNISNVIDMTNMFSQVNANRAIITSTQLDTIVAQIKSWDVSNVTTMKKMFFNNENFNDVHVIPLRTWNVTSDTILTDIFTQTAAKSKSPVSVIDGPITHNFFNQPESPPSIPITFGNAIAAGNISQLISNPDTSTNGQYPVTLTLVTKQDGTDSHQTQELIINLTTLTGGDQYVIVKSAANGNNFTGDPINLTIGENTINVAGVAFDRDVKILFNNVNTEFDSLVHNTNTIYPV